MKTLRFLPVANGKSSFASLLLLALFFCASYKAQAFTYVVVRGASQVCPYNVVSYEIDITNIFPTQILIVSVSGGTIVDIPEYSNETYNAMRTQAKVDASLSDNPVRSCTAIVRWGAGGSGSFSANIGYDIGIFGGMQWNSDSIDVANGLGTLGSIGGARTISCGTSTSSYSISPVFGADSYEWSSSSPALQVLDNGNNSANFDVSNFRGSATITVIARNNTCNVTGMRTLSVSRVPARGGVSGTSQVCSGTVAYYSAIDQSSYAPLLGSGFVWGLPSGWSIIDGDGTGDISVQVPSYYATRPSSVTLSYQAFDGCGNSVRGSIGVQKMPNSNCYMERILPPTKDEKAKDTTDATDTDEIVAFMLYPNPSQGQVTLSCGTKESGTLKIYDKLGTEVASFANVSNGFVFTVTGLVADTYTARWITIETVKTFRLVVNHN